jgi:hypothetical protein
VLVLKGEVRETTKKRETHKNRADVHVKHARNWGIWRSISQMAWVDFASSFFLETRFYVRRWWKRFTMTPLSTRFILRSISSSA